MRKPCCGATLCAAVALLLVAVTLPSVVHAVEKGRGELHAVVDCYVPSDDPSALPLQLISHIVDFVDEKGQRQDRRDIALMYLPHFAGKSLRYPEACVRRAPGSCA